MKKYYITALLILVTALAGCGKKADNTPDTAPKATQQTEESAEKAEKQETTSENDSENKISEDVKEAATAEAGEIQTIEVADDGLGGLIKAVNPDAVVEQTLNPGMRMLRVDLPISENKEKAFFEQVKKIIDDCGLAESNDFDFFYFSTSENGNIQICAAFKNIGGEFLLETVAGIDPAYANAPTTAASVSDIFKAE